MDLETFFKAHNYLHVSSFKPYKDGAIAIINTPEGEISQIVDEKPAEIIRIIEDDLSKATAEFIKLLKEESGLESLNQFFVGDYIKLDGDTYRITGIWTTTREEGIYDVDYRAVDKDGEVYYFSDYELPNAELKETQSFSPDPTPKFQQGDIIQPNVNTKEVALTHEKETDSKFTPPEISVGDTIELHGVGYYVDGFERNCLLEGLLDTYTVTEVITGDERELSREDLLAAKVIQSNSTIQPKFSTGDIIQWAGGSYYVENVYVYEHVFYDLVNKSTGWKYSVRESDLPDAVRVTTSKFSEGDWIKIDKFYYRVDKVTKGDFKSKNSYELTERDSGQKYIYSESQLPSATLVFDPFETEIGAEYIEFHTGDKVKVTELFTKAKDGTVILKKEDGTVFVEVDGEIGEYYHDSLALEISADEFDMTPALAKALGYVKVYINESSGAVFHSYPNYDLSAWIPLENLKELKKNSPDFFSPDFQFDEY